MLTTVLIYAALFIFSCRFDQRAGEMLTRVMVLPFENTSDKPEFNWVGESFADVAARSALETRRECDLNVPSGR